MRVHLGTEKKDGVTLGGMTVYHDNSTVSIFTNVAVLQEPSTKDRGRLFRWYLSQLSLMHANFQIGRAPFTLIPGESLVIMLNDALLYRWLVNKKPPVQYESTISEMCKLLDMGGGGYLYYTKLLKLLQCKPENYTVLSEVFSG